MALESAEQIITKMLTAKIDNAFWGVDTAKFPLPLGPDVHSPMTFPFRAGNKYTSKWGRIEHKLCRMKYKNVKQWLYAYRWMRDTHPHVTIQIYTSDRSKFDMIKEIILNRAVSGVTISENMHDKIRNFYKLQVFNGLGS